MKLSPLQPKGIYFTRVDLTAIPDAESSDVGKINVEADVSCIQPDQSATDWFVLLKLRIVSLENVKAPYVGLIELCGSFSINSSWPKEGARRLAYINGAGILYTAAREMVSNITARGFYESLTLPGLSFFDMFKEEEENAAQPSLPLEEEKPKAPKEPAQP